MATPPPIIRRLNDRNKRQETPMAGNGDTIIALDKARMDAMTALDYAKLDEKSE